MLAYSMHGSLNRSPPVLTLLAYDHRSGRMQEAPDAAAVAAAPNGRDGPARDAKPADDAV